MTPSCVSAPALRSQSRDGSALEEARGPSVLLLEIAGRGHRARIPDGPTGGFHQVGPKLAGVEPRAYLREATLRAVRNPGTVTLARDLK